MGDFPRNASRLSRIKMAEDVGKDACIRFTAESEFKELNEQMSQLKRAICLRTWGTQHTFVFKSEVVRYLQLYTGKKKCQTLLTLSIEVSVRGGEIHSSPYWLLQYFSLNCLFVCSVHHAETRLQYFIPLFNLIWKGEALKYEKVLPVDCCIYTFERRFVVLADNSYTLFTHWCHSCFLAHAVTDEF